jgi:hypothetical protein
MREIEFTPMVSCNNVCDLCLTVIFYVLMESRGEEGGGDVGSVEKGRE